MSIIKKSKPSKDSSTANIGFEAKLWLAYGNCSSHRINMSPDSAFGSSPATAGFVQSGKFVEPHTTATLALAA